MYTHILIHVNNVITIFDYVMIMIKQFCISILDLILQY